MIRRARTVRVVAVEAVLEVGMKLRQVVDLETQVADLERRFDEQESTDGVTPRGDDS